MPSYHVRFLKRVVDGRGRERRICQRAVVVEADGSKPALLRARSLFCSLEGVAHWSLRSDGHQLNLVGTEAASPGPQEAPAASGLRPAQIDRQRPLAEIDG